MNLYNTAIRSKFTKLNVLSRPEYAKVITMSQWRIFVLCYQLPLSESSPRLSVRWRRIRTRWRTSIYQWGHSFRCQLRIIDGKLSCNWCQERRNEQKRENWDVSTLTPLYYQQKHLKHHGSSDDFTFKLIFGIKIYHQTKSAYKRFCRTKVTLN